MKLSTKSLALIAAAGLLSLGSVSQAAQTNQIPPGTHQGMRGAEGQMNRMAQELKLTEDQKPKVKAILEEREKKMAEFRKAKDATPEDRRAKGKTLRQDTNLKLKEVLTPEQFAKYEEMQKAHGAAAGNPDAGQPKPKKEKGEKK